MTKYAGRYVLTITADHIQHPKTLGREWFKISRAIGCLLPIDEGKQVWETSPDVYQVENDAQCKARQQKERLA